MAHSATDSTPTLRGRLSSSESTSTAWHLAPRGAAGGGGVLAFARQQPGGQPLGLPFERPAGAAQQGPLAAVQLLHPGTQGRPLLLG